MTESRYFIACHDFMIHDLKLKGFSLLIYALLYNFWTCYKANYLSVPLIMERTGCSRRQVYSVCKELNKRGLVDLIRNEVVYLNPYRAEIAQLRAETAHISLCTNIKVSTNLEESLEEYEKRNEKYIKKD